MTDVSVADQKNGEESHTYRSAAFPDLAARQILRRFGSYESALAPENISAFATVTVTNRELLTA